jgi:hypothetical protein
MDYTDTSAVRFLHLPAEDSVLLDSSVCMYRPVHRVAVACLGQHCALQGSGLGKLCNKRGGCRVECQQGQLVSWRWGLTVLIRN